MLKEIFDRTLAFLGLIFASPVMGLLSLLIKVESPGPAFFKHLRVGIDGSTFWMYKFRKMPHKIDSGPKISPKHDLRLTKVGKVIERLKLDEIPQLINIFKGEMSFVGPRPEIPEIVELYSERERKVLSVKPGLVGPNQIIWRNEKNLIPADVEDVEAYYIKEILPQKLERDIKYAETQSFIKDLKYFTHAFLVTVFEPMKLIHLIRRKREISKLLIDISLSMIAFFFALLVKNDFQPAAIDITEIGVLFIIISFWQVVCYIFFSIYLHLWKYFGTRDLIAIMKSITLAAALSTMTIMFFQIPWMSISIILLNAIFTASFLVCFRMISSRFKRSRFKHHSTAQENILIYGANMEGELFARRILANLGPRVEPVGFLDHHDHMRGKKIHGFSVLGTAIDLPLLKNVHDIEAVYIATEKQANGDLSQLLDICKNLNIKYHFVSTIYSTEVKSAGNGLRMTMEL